MCIRDRNKVVHMSGLSGRDDLLVGGVQAAVADVLHDGTVEQPGILQHLSLIHISRATSSSAECAMREYVPGISTKMVCIPLWV